VCLLLVALAVQFDVVAAVFGPPGVSLDPTVLLLFADNVVAGVQVVKAVVAVFVGNSGALAAFADYRFFILAVAEFAQVNGPALQGRFVVPLAIVVNVFELKAVDGAWFFLVFAVGDDAGGLLAQTQGDEATILATADTCPVRGGVAVRAVRFTQGV